MLDSLSFTNFKSWEKADLQCGRITGIFGTNSSGKTSLLQFLLLLKQTKEATDRGIALELNGDFVELGTIRDAIHCHDEERSIVINLAFGLPTDLSLADPSEKRTATVAKGRILGFEAEIGVQQRAPVARRIAYTLGEMSFALAPRKGEATSFDLSAAPLNGLGTNFSFKRTIGRKWQLPGPIKSYAFPDQARTYFQNSGFLSNLEAAYEAQLDEVFYLGPLREYPKRDYLWARSRPTNVGQRGEKTIDAILAATEAGEKRNLRSKARLMPRDNQDENSATIRMRMPPRGYRRKGVARL